MKSLLLKNLNAFKVNALILLGIKPIYFISQELILLCKCSFSHGGGGSISFKGKNNETTATLLGQRMQLW